jgi:crossover junction endodeoxyribonuclease RuvC
MVQVAKERIILGIDPGTNIMGFGLIIDKGKQIELIALDVIKLDHLETHPLKLRSIFIKVLALIDHYHPDEVALEAPFFGKNVQSMLKLGRAQGVAMAAALYRDIPIFEYSPRKVKQSITGRGNASKEQVSAMINRLLVIKEQPKYFDATDAVAVACCHYFQGTTEVTGKSYNGWGAFINANPDRVK